MCQKAKPTNIDQQKKKTNGKINKQNKKECRDLQIDANGIMKTQWFETKLREIYNENKMKNEWIKKIKKKAEVKDVQSYADNFKGWIIGIQFTTCVPVYQKTKS